MKQCSVKNDKALRDAKNITDLVSINMATVDKQLYMRTRGQSTNGKPVDETNYNLHQDALNFMQKMPCMGDRDFLVNQSILHNSTTRNRISESINRKKFMAQTRNVPRGGTPNNLTMPNQQNYWSGQTPQEMAARARNSNNGILRSLLPELPLGGLQVKRPRQNQHSNKTMRAKSLKTRSSLNAQTEHDTQENTQTADTQQDHMDDVDQTVVQIDGRGSQIDPVRCLQKIFRPNERKTRRPGVSLIAEKYKIEARSAKSRIGSRMVATANTFMTSGQFNLNSAQNQAFSTRNDMPMTPVHQPGYFSNVDDRASCATAPPTDAILLQREESHLAPPATAPIGASRNDIVIKPGYRANTELEATASSVMMSNGKERQSTVSDRMMNASISNATPGDSKLEKKNSQLSRFKRKTTPIMVEQTTQLDKRSNVASSILGMSNQQFSSGQHPKSQLMTEHGSQFRPSAASELVSPNIGEALSQAQNAVRDKLAQMKKLFADEEDDQNTDLQTRAKKSPEPLPESSDWDLHRHKLAYEDAMDKRQHFMQVEQEKQRTNGFKGETPLSFYDNKKQNASTKESGKGGNKSKLQSNLEMHEDELKEFLMHRIAELKSAEDHKLEDLNSAKFKFRASTISNVLPSGNVHEASRLENNYKNRFRNKGAKLHQRMLNSQQRCIKERVSAQRKSHQRALEAAKKDIVSQRSRETSPQQTRSNYNTNQSPSRPDILRMLSDSESKNMMARQRSVSRQNHRRQNIDLDDDVIQPRDTTEHGAISTQQASYQNGLNIPRTPQVMSREKPIPHIVDPDAIIVSDYFSEREIGEQIELNDRQTPNSMTIEDPELVNDQFDDPMNQLQTKTVPSLERVQIDQPEPYADYETFKKNNTAIVFMVDDPNMNEGKKINYFTKVLRRIDLIDRQHAKEQKRRKAGLRQEVMEIIQHAVDNDHHAAASKSCSPSSYGSEGKNVLKDLHFVEDDEEDELEEISTDHDAVNTFTVPPPPVEDYEIQRKSTMMNLQGTHQQTQDSTIILSVAGEACEMGEHPNRIRQRSIQRNRVSNITPSRNLDRVQQQPSRTLSRDSNHSRVHTAENIMTTDDQEYLCQQRISDGTGSIGQEPVKLIVMQHGSRIVDANGQPVSMPMSLPRTVSRGSQQSLKEESVEVSPDEANNKGDYTGMATISNTRLDGDSIGHMYDQKQTFSVKLSARGSINQQQSTQRHISEHGAIAGGAHLMDFGPPRSRAQSRTLTSHISQNQPVDDTPTPRSTNMTYSQVTGSQLAYFCPKRFNRFPRFTIFFKKGLEKEDGSFVSENTVSLNADFLKFLSDKRGGVRPATQIANGGIRVHSQKIEEQNEDENHDTSGAMKDSSGGVTPHSNILGAANNDIAGDCSRRHNGREPSFRAGDIEKAEQASSGYLGGRVPIDVEQWNDYLKQKNFDPFDRVVLVKSIDNSILTSFRTLKGDNNTVSDTFKIVHRKFQPQRTQNSFFKNMMTKNADKLLYQTHMVKPLTEQSNEDDFQYSRASDLLQADDVNTIQCQQQQQTDSPEPAHPSQLSQKHGPRPKHLVVDPSKAKPSSRAGVLNEAKLQHAVTAALFEINDQRGLSTPTAKATVITQQSQFQQQQNTQAYGGDKKSPFKVKNKPSDNDLRESQGKNRMPRPKALNITGTAASKRKHSHTITASANMTQQQQTSFGVTGISPLAQHNLVGSVYARDIERQETEMFEQNSPNEFRSLMMMSPNQQPSIQPTLEKPNVTSVCSKPTGSISPPFNSKLQEKQQYGSSAMNTSQQESTQNDDRVMAVESENKIVKQPTETEKDKRDIKLMMQPTPNFQFNSTATVKRGKDDALSNQPSSKTQQSGDAYAGRNDTKSRNTDTWTENYISGAKSNQVSGAIQIRKGRNHLKDKDKDVLPKSTLQLDSHKNTSPTFLSSINREQQLYEPPSTKLPHKILDSQRKLISNSNTQPVQLDATGSLHANDGAMESVTEFVSTGQQKFQAVKANIMSPPLVSVIRSNTAIASGGATSSVKVMGGANEGQPGDGTVRTGGVTVPKSSHLESTQMVQEAIEMITSSPIVHTALQGRRVNKKIAAAANKDLQKFNSDINNASVNNWTTLGAGSAFSGTSPRFVTDRTKKQVAPKPAEHVGVLTVPDSLKTQHTSAIFGVETVATSQPGAHKKGAVSSMIDKIYQRDRRMVNNMYKGNMLSTAVLTDMRRYHKLKSQTGVEATNHDDKWLQERIDEELREPGLSLDFAPGTMKALEPAQHQVQHQPQQQQQSPTQQSTQQTYAKQIRQRQMMESPVPSPFMHSTQRHDMVFDNVENVNTETKPHMNQTPVPQMSTDKTVRKSLEGTLGDLIPTTQAEGQNMNDHGLVVEPIEAVNYSEMVNRSDLGTHLGRSNYN